MSDSVAVRFGIAGVRLLPRNAISRLAGRVAGLRLPRILRAPFFRLFGLAVGVDFDEVRDPLPDHESLQAFFTRALRPGVRPIHAAPDAFVAPCDGAWGESGQVRDGLLLQLKGRPYSLAELLGDAGLAARFEGGAFATLYLAPRDYHRFHTPCALRVLRATHIPGSLWPVNTLGLEGVDGLFAQNERIVAQMRVDQVAVTDASVVPDLCLVAVGATMVGCVRLAFDELTTNRPGALRSERTYDDPPITLAKGEEWGRFEFGSTIVVVAAPGAIELHARPTGTPLRLGTRIGRLVSPEAPASA
jgi:phosphatidylserine decarboxylase